jgi:hypothetical protein
MAAFAAFWPAQQRQRDDEHLRRGLHGRTCGDADPSVTGASATTSILDTAFLAQRAAILIPWSGCGALTSICDRASQANVRRADPLLSSASTMMSILDEASVAQCGDADPLVGSASQTKRISTSHHCQHAAVAAFESALPLHKGVS